MERDFKGVWIPKHIWLNESLSMLDKVLLVEIDSLDQSERGCFASNKYFAEFCGCSESAVSKSISKLIKLGFLYYNSFNGRQRELKSRISNYPERTDCGNKSSKIYQAASQNLQSCIVKNDKQPSKIYQAASQNLPHNNIDNNIDKEENSQNFLNIIEDYIKQNKDKLNNPKEIKQRIINAYNELSDNLKDRLDVTIFEDTLTNLLTNKRWAASEEIKKLINCAIIFNEHDNKVYNIYIQKTINSTPKSFSIFGYHLRTKQTVEDYLRAFLKNKDYYCGWIGDKKEDNVVYAK